MIYYSMGPVLKIVLPQNVNKIEETHGNEILKYIYFL